MTIADILNITDKQKNYIRVITKEVKRYDSYINPTQYKVLVKSNQEIPNDLLEYEVKKIHANDRNYISIEI